MIAQRITKAGVIPFLENKYKSSPILIEGNIISDITPLLQKNYGEDCKITAIISTINYLLDNKRQPEDIYKLIFQDYTDYISCSHRIEKIKICFFRQLISKFNLKIRIYKRFLKNIGIHFNMIKDSINNDIPIIINILDNESFYTNDSLIIIGYDIFKVGRKSSHILYIYDSLSTVVNVIEWEELNYWISAIFIKK